MLRPNLLFHSWKELPASIIVLHFTDPNQPVTQIDDLIDFKDPAYRKRLIQFLSIFGWILHDCFMTSIPYFHLDRSIGRSLTLNVGNNKVLGYQPAEQKEPSLAAIQREIDQLKNYVVTLTVKSNLPARDSFNQSQARAPRNSLAARMISIPGLKKISGDPSPISNHHQPWTREEEEQLREEFQSGQNIKDIAATHNRSQLAIQSRLLKLQLVPTI